MKLNWFSKTTIFCLIILAGFLAQQKLKQYQMQKAIQAEKTSLENQLNELGGKNQELNATLGYLNSGAYKEIIARQQLNMQKQGEFVYNFSDEKAESLAPAAQKPKAVSNARKWLAYFLNQEKP